MACLVLAASWPLMTIITCAVVLFVCLFVLNNFWLIFVILDKLESANPELVLRVRVRVHASQTRRHLRIHYIVS